MNLADELQKLDNLRASGALTEEEYAKAKALLLENKLSPTPNPLRRITRSNTDIWLGGVCGGLGASTPLPSWGWRVIFCIGAIVYGVGLLPYVLLWIFLPEEGENR